MKNKIIMIVVQVVLLIVAAGATWWFMRPAPQPSAEEVAAAAEPASKEPIYFSIHPPFVVNLADGRTLRFLQVEMELMTRDSDVEDLLKKHQPRVRNDLMLSKLTREEVMTEESRLKIQQDSVDIVNKVLMDEAGKGGVEAVYFSKFVMQ